MRNNPLTVGFYTPQVSLGSNKDKQMVLSTPKPQQEDDDSDAGEDIAARAAENYLLPSLDREADRMSRERLDEDTKLRRRVYEMLLAANCKELRSLDGLEVEKQEIGRRDEIWGRLGELGIVRSKNGAKDHDNDSIE